MIGRINKDLTEHMPDELVDTLISSYKDLKENYFLRKFEPSELNGGKFVEACIRIIQYTTDAGNYTPIGGRIINTIKVLRDFEVVNSNIANESFRIHIPRVLCSIYNIRNKRGVGHLGDDVNPNIMDATLIMSSVDWVLAELFRVYFACDIEEAEDIVNALIKRPVPIIEEIENVKRVLKPNLRKSDETLVLLASEYPNKVTEADLFKWVEPKDVYYYRNNVLKKLHEGRLIERRDGVWCIITAKGLDYVEGRYREWVV